MTQLATWVAVNLQTTYGRLKERQEGQGLVEYALIIAFIGILVIVALIFLKDKIKDLFSKTGNSLTS